MAKTKIDFKKVAIKTVATGVGAVAGAMANKAPFIKDQKPALRGLIKVGVGAGISALLGKHKKFGEAAEAFGSGMIAVGAVEGASALITVPSLAGIGSAMRPVIGNIQTIGNTPVWPVHQR